MIPSASKVTDKAEFARGSALRRVGASGARAHRRDGTGLISEDDLSREIRHAIWKVPSRDRYAALLQSKRAERDVRRGKRSINTAELFTR